MRQQKGVLNCMDHATGEIRLGSSELERQKKPNRYSFEGIDCQRYHEISLASEAAIPRKETCDHGRWLSKFTGYASSRAG